MLRNFAKLVFMQMDFNALVNDFARGQKLAILLSRNGGSVRDDLADSAVDPDEDNSGLEPAAEAKCGCGGEPDWNGVVCWNCRDTGNQNAELYNRGMI